MRETPASDTPVAVDGAGFHRLRRRARQIERYILLLVVLVALVPPTVFTVRSIAEAGGLREVEARGAGRELVAETAAVFAVHIVVGIGLGFLVYRVPVRALEAAIRELEATQAQLLHANKLAAMGEVYAGLAHEVNNPLGVMLARTQLLRASAEERGLDPEAAKDLEVIERNGTRIAEIVRGLLAFSRRSELVLRRASLRDVVREVVTLVEKPFARDGVRLEIHLAADLPAILASPEHLQQVFLNLFTNARDAMPGGGVIRVRTGAREGGVAAEVEDSGPGLAPEVRQRLFEPFFTTKEGGRGTGLGLSVSYGIVKAHGGELEAGNAAGGGALFRLTLPVAPPERP
jgi:signal transduction histidine kinase